MNIFVRLNGNLFPGSCRLLPGNTMLGRLRLLMRGGASGPVGYEAEPRNQCVATVLPSRKMFTAEASPSK